MTRWRRPTARQALLLAGVVALTLFGMAMIVQHGGPTSSAVVASGGETPRSDLPTIAVADLPPEALHTLALIDRGGPFPFRQDGTTFRNFERRLPERELGYYREFTVITPGEDDRGRRRLVAGAAGDIYYTSDHYETFRQVLR
jgi:ribonuclease T1